MKRVALTALGLSMMVTGAASAADMAVKAPPIAVAPPCIWCGFYVGLNAGYAWSDNSVSSVGNGVQIEPLLSPTIPPAAAASVTGPIPAGRSDGFIGGAQAGYNFQSRNFVFGVETDIQGLSGRGSGTVSNSVIWSPPSSVNSTLTASNKVEWLGTLRGRAGLTIAPNFLVYGTAGLAYGQVNSSVAITQQVVGIGGVPAGGAAALVSSLASASETRVGWAAGAGGEWMLSGNWSAKLEYLHYDLGGVNYNGAVNNFATVGAPVPVGTPIYTVNTRNSTNFRGDIVRVGLNYKLGGPVVAKY